MGEPAEKEVEPEDAFEDDLAFQICPQCLSATIWRPIGPASYR